MLAHQVHMLSEQVSAQNEKITDLERLISDKTQHVASTEDMLQRVRFHLRSTIPKFRFYLIVINVYKIHKCFVSFIQERLTRSSLETQKLELMSAMSELKLQQAVLERENLELRASQFNNNTIGMDRRLPPVPGNRIRTNSSSGSMVFIYFSHQPIFMNKHDFMNANLICRRRHHLTDVKWTFIIIVCRDHPL